jgi:hypothetical protein
MKSGGDYREIDVSERTFTAASGNGRLGCFNKTSNGFRLMKNEALKETHISMKKLRCDSSDNSLSSI